MGMEGTWQAYQQRSHAMKEFYKVFLIFSAACFNFWQEISSCEYSERKELNSDKTDQPG